MMNELISILTPVYKGTDCLANAVQSVIAQSWQDWELLVVSDDGEDYQRVLLEQGIEDERIRFFATEKPKSGPNVGRNVALAQARGQWIAPLDADDVYYPERLTKLWQGAQETGLALDNVMLAEGADFSSKTPVLDMPSGNMIFEEFEQSLVPLLMLFRRDLIECGWDEDVIRGADTLFNLRALENAGYAHYIAEPLHEYRVHNESMCHASGADQLFIDAYRHTLNRLASDGLGFKTSVFRDKVHAMIALKEKINAEFNQAVHDGYRGNYQEFVALKGLR